MKPFTISKSGTSIDAAGFKVTVTSGPVAAAVNVEKHQDAERRKLVEFLAASPLMYKALVRIHDNITRWIATEQPAGPEESRAIYEEISAALAAAGNPTDLLQRVNEYENPGSTQSQGPLPHELFVWCIQQGMPEGSETAEQIQWLQTHVRRLQSKVDEAEYIKRRFCDVVPMLTSKSWEDIWERVRDRFKHDVSAQEKPKRLPVDRPWSEYPIGTKAHAFNGGHWIRVRNGWKWFNGSTFPTPGADAIGECIELPTYDVSASQETPR
jgi:hypothetical protein